jgi:hypothetical protein
MRNMVQQLLAQLRRQPYHFLRLTRAQQPRRLKESLVVQAQLPLPQQPILFLVHVSADTPYRLGEGEIHTMSYVSLRPFAPLV